MIGLVSRAVSGPRSKWIVIAVWVGLLVVFLPESMTISKVTSDQTATADSLPDSSQAARVAETVRRDFPGGEAVLAVNVYRRDSGLTDADRAKIAADAAAVQKVEGVGPVHVPFGPGALPGLASRDGRSAFIAIPVLPRNSDDRNDTIEHIRDVTGKGSGGLQIRLTGTSALQSDLTTTLQSTDGALLVATGLLVLILLIIIYRSPLIPLLPLVVVGFAYTIAEGIVHIGADALDITVDRTAITLLAILMFGAGTDYCLLLVARYSTELRAHEDKHIAIGNAVRRAGPAIAASGLVVAGALTTLIVADLNLDQVFGPVNAVGVLVGMSASLTLLPALLAVVGRRGFWPSARHIAYQPPVEKAALAPELAPLPSVITQSSIADLHPAVRQRDPIWRKVGLAALRRPVLTLVLVGGALVVCAFGLSTYKEDVNVVGQFRADAESVEGFRLLQKSFPAGTLLPNTVLISRDGAPVTDADVVAATAAVRGVPGVAAVQRLPKPESTSRDGTKVTLIATFAGDPFSNASLDRVKTIRSRLAALSVGGRSVLLGDGTALRVDYRDAARADQRKVAPIALAVITLLLIILLRAVVAPLYLLCTTVLSFAATLGISLVVFDKVWNEPTVDPAFPLLAFVFLVALGVDYNIFLMDRVREEAREHGTREGMLRALVATGPVITSAGIVLAGTFAVLMTLPLDILLELGFAVALGVLLDTFVVRTLIVPAVVTLFGDASWWPSKLRPPAPSAPAPVGAAALPAQPPPPPPSAQPLPSFPPPGG